jgi:hypothetical protein
MSAWRQRAVEVARVLQPTQRAVLVRALAPDLLGLSSSYMPTSAEEDHFAVTIAHPSLGLLWPEEVNRTHIYRPTPFGRLVLQAYLLERVAGEPLGAWPAVADERDYAKGRRVRGR